MSTSVSDVAAVLTAAKADFVTALADFSAQVAALKASIVALQGQTAPDLSGLLAQAQDLDTSIKAADPGAQPAPSAS